MKAVALCLSRLFCVPLAAAADVAPRIGDREIVESLAEVKAGQRVLQQQISRLQSSTQRQMDDSKASNQQQTSDLKASNQKQFEML